jgi:hypothetical protein
MNRSSFVKACFAATGFLTAPFTAVARRCKEWYKKSRSGAQILQKVVKTLYERPTVHLQMHG